MRLALLFTAIGLLVGHVPLIGQEDKAYLEETDQEALEALSRKFAQEEQKGLEQARQLARQQNVPIRQVLEDGTVIAVSGIGPTGLLQFQTTTNLDAAKTSSTSKAWPGNALGVSLTGNGYNIGAWDGGIVYKQHQDLAGRITNKDNNASVIDHATHVTGTLVGSDSVNGARGMAYKATLDAYDWNSDNSEMASAGSSGLLISNHSYGQITGWRYRDDKSEWYWYGATQVSQKEDYRFGFYSRDARNWDQIARNAPYYLIVKSAGNDRNDDGPSGSNDHKVRNSQNNWVSSTRKRDPDGSYDCLGPKSTAKNILTVGAVNDIPSGYSQPSDVSMTSFSSWGPTDDGRIKPDLVANGRSLKSCGTDNPSDYDRKSGTSMSAPVASGSMLLLQEHYKHTYNQQMRAASLKGLAIHTADEAGPDAGPDYEHGWGLLNTANAIKHITNASGGDFLLEETLQDQQTYTFTVNASQSNPLSATLSWHDPAGNPPSPQVDPTTKMLVNDLDLRIRRKNGNQVYKPYVMDPANPDSAATRGDNTRDNVEQVFVKQPQSGSYVVEVTHKGALSSPQAFSLVISAEGRGCQPPGGLTVDSVQNTKADLSWTSFSSQCPDSATQWKVQWGRPGFSIDQGDSISVTQSQARITGLAGNSKYEAYVAEIRSGGKRTDYVGPVTFTTTPQPVQLPYFEGFESFSGTYTEGAEITGPQNAFWQFRSSEPEGRLRFAGSDITASKGTQAATLDVNQDNNLAENDLILTLNMRNYSAQRPLFLKFDHREYDEEDHPNDSLWIRGSNEDQWVGLYDLSANASNNYQQAGRFDISQALRQAGQQFTATFQVRFGQEDNYTLEGRLKDGRSFDEVSINRQDLVMDDWVKPADACNLTSQEPLKVVVRNNSVQTLAANSRFSLSYRINGNQTTEQVTLQQDLKPQDTLHYQFTSPVDLSPGGGPYNLTSTVSWNEDQISRNDTIRKQIRPRPQPDVSFSRTLACAGEPVTLQEQVDPKGGTVTSYQWDLGNGQTAAGPQATPTYTQTGSLTVSLAILTKGGCRDTASQTFPVNPEPDAAFDASSLCGLADVQFTEAVQPNGAAIQAYDWQLGDGQASADPQVNHTYDQAGTYNVKLTVTTDKGCADALQKQLPVAVQPEAAYTVEQPCAGEPAATTNATIPSGNASIQFSWQSPGSGEITTSAEPLLTFPESGTYEVSLVATSETDTLQCRDQATKEIQVGEAVPAAFTKSTGKPGEVTLIPEQTNANQYNWQLGNGRTSTEVEPTVTYDTNGTYEVTLITTSAGGCRDTATQAIAIERVGLADEKPGSGFDAYPNPVNAGEKLTIAYQGGQKQPLRLSLVNTRGKQVCARELRHHSSGNHQATMTIPQELSAGVYILKLSGNHTRVVKRLVIAKNE
jgi:PKD repeat protein